MSKWKNYGLWVAVVAFIPILTTALGTYDISIILPGNYDILCESVLGILVLLGVISNPSQGTGFKDSDKK